jgi:hypothetical protein
VEALGSVTAIALARSTLLALIHRVPGIGDTVLAKPDEGGRVASRTDVEEDDGHGVRQDLR